MGVREVTLEWPDGRRRTIEVESGETVLRASERAGRAVPYGCRIGACASCVGRVLEVGGRNEDGEGDGSVDGAGPIDPADAFEYCRAPRALKPRHRDDGYVLLCIATPRTNCRVAVGSRIQSELVDNPWK